MQEVDFGGDEVVAQILFSRSGRKATAGLEVSRPEQLTEFSNDVGVEAGDELNARDDLPDEIFVVG